MSYKDDRGPDNIGGGENSGYSGLAPVEDKHSGGFSGYGPDPDDASPEGANSGVPGFLELVYGVLFEPVGTMKKVARRPPLVSTALIVAILSFFGALMGILTASRVLAEGLPAALEQFIPAIRALAPLGAVSGLFWGYLKWFGYSAILHLSADLLGGRGGARGVFAVVGLAGLPALLTIPVQLLSYLYGPESTVVAVLVSLAALSVWVWGFILLVIGLREVHGLSTGRTVLVILSPYLALALLLLILLAFIAFVIASLPFAMNAFPPVYF